MEHPFLVSNNNFAAFLSEFICPRGGAHNIKCQNRDAILKKHEMRRLKICEIFAFLFFIIAVLTFINLKEQLIEDGFSENDDFVESSAKLGVVSNVKQT